MRHPLRVFVAVGIVVACLAAGGAVLAASGPETRTRPAPTALPAPAAQADVPTRVLVLGDSNLFYADAPVQQALGAAGIEGELRGVGGFGLKDFESFWLPLVPGLVQAQDPDVVAVALGTNDVWTEKDIKSFRSRLDAMMRAIGDRRVVWVTHIEEHGDLPYPGRRINNAIRAAASRWSNLAVLDLAPLLTANTSLLGADLIHFSPVGQQVFGREIAAAVQTTADAPLDFKVSLTPPTVPVVPLG